MGGVERNGGQHGHQLPSKKALDPVGVALGPVRSANETNVFRFQRRNERIVQHPVLLVHQIVDPLRDALELLSRAQVIRAPLGRAIGKLLLEPGHPDLKKLVEVRRRDA